MEKHLFFLLIISNLYFNNIAKEKKIVGEWKFIKITTFEKIGKDLYREKNSGSLSELKIEFKKDYNGISKSSESNTGEAFSWYINDNKVGIAYNGDNLILKSFNGEFTIKVLTKNKMHLFDEIKNKTIFFEK
ncbi:lipocalin family protein [Flavobacterium sp.]|uniref:lipocalin family protein n=1 Tax=Flavobacterium sp. TaxID=239 RepID=UPI0040489F70